MASKNFDNELERAPEVMENEDRSGGAQNKEQQKSRSIGKTQNKAQLNEITAQRCIDLQRRNTKRTNQTSAKIKRKTDKFQRR